MTEIPGLDSRRYSKYSSVSDETKARYKGFEKIKEYEHFYLCGRYNDKGELLYKECFSKFDVDGVKGHIKSHLEYHIRIGGGLTDDNKR